jgi:hypothetical protein
MGMQNRDSYRNEWKRRQCEERAHERQKPSDAPASVLWTVLVPVAIASVGAGILVAIALR